ncbi:MAG TPA: hypothetical protein V6D08_02860 [Candidatus Obscuribacterales bacterium]
MSEFELTKDEKRCLQNWFRQAIAQVEREEATARLAQWFGIGEGANHRSQSGRRRARRAVNSVHARENALV